jgi:hypothetical protein
MELLHPHGESLKDFTILFMANSIFLLTIEFLLEILLQSGYSLFFRIDNDRIYVAVVPVPPMVYQQPQYVQPAPPTVNPSAPLVTPPPYQYV